MTTGAAKPPLSEATRLVGDQVRTRRNELALSQETLAQLASLHWSYVSRVERGQVNLTLHSLARFAHALQIPPADLLRNLPATDMTDQPQLMNPLGDESGTPHQASSGATKPSNPRGH